MHYLIKTKSVTIRDREVGTDLVASVREEKITETGDVPDDTRASMADADEAAGCWSGTGENHAQIEYSTGGESVPGARQHRSGTWMQNTRASWMGSTSWWRKKASVSPTGGSVLQANAVRDALSAVHVDKGITRTQNGHLVKADRPSGSRGTQAGAGPWRYRLWSWWCAWTDVEDPFTRRVFITGFGEALHPHAPIYALWNNFLMLMMIYPFIIVPVQAGFGLHYPIFTSFLWINQWALLTDIVVTFWMGVLVGKTGDHVEKRPMHVAKLYLSSWFLFDLLTSVPWKDILPLVLGHTWITDTKAVVESLELIKIFRFASIYRRGSFSLPSYGMKYAQRAMIVFVLLVMLVSHWMACAWMLMARVYLSWYPSEYEQVWWSSANLVPDVDSPQSQYVIAVYYSITIMATIGYGDITPQNGFERTLCIAAMVLGTMCYAYCITQLVEMVAHWHHADVRFKAHQDHLIEYMRARNLPMEVQKRILKFYDFQQRHTAVFYNENDILEQLTPRLRAEVLHLAHNDSVSLLQGLPLFEDLEESSLSKIIVSLRSSFLPPDEIVCIAGEVGRQLYIIRKGVVAVMRDSHRPLFISDGQSFGESVLYRPNVKRSSTVLTHSYCQLMMLSKAAIDSALQSRPEQYQLVMAKAKLLYREHTRRSKGELPDEVQAVGRDALSLQSSVDVDDTGNIMPDSIGPGETNTTLLGGSPSKGAQMWKSLLSVRPVESSQGASSAAIGKLSQDVADLKRAVNELLALAKTQNEEGE